MKKNGMREENKTAGVFARSLFSSLGATLIFLFSTGESVFADEVKDKVFAERAETAFERAQTEFQSNTNNPTAAWHFAHACFDWADWATNKSQRAEIAKKGIAACQQSLLITNTAAAHYYLALNNGQLARAETIGGLKLVGEIQSEFQAARDLDASFNFAGPARGLGQLYRDAPGWPVSIGNHQKALETLETAVALAPDFPANVLVLAESDLEWNNRAKAKKELDTLDALWPKAQKSLAGEEWESNWDDWSKRRDTLRKLLNQQ